MKNDKILSVIFMIKSLKLIFGDDLRPILLKGFGIDIKKIKRISRLNNEFYILKNFYDSEVDNYRKKIRKYNHYEKVIKKKSKIMVSKISDVISLNNWEGIYLDKCELPENWSDGIGLISKKGEKYVNFI